MGVSAWKIKNKFRPNSLSFFALRTSLDHNIYFQNKLIDPILSAVQLLLKNSSFGIWGIDFVSNKNYFNALKIQCVEDVSEWVVEKQTHDQEREHIFDVSLNAYFSLLKIVIAQSHILHINISLFIILKKVLSKYYLWFIKFDQAILGQKVLKLWRITSSIITIRFQSVAKRINTTIFVCFISIGTIITLIDAQTKSPGTNRKTWVL